jgi:TIR domain
MAWEIEMPSHVFVSHVSEESEVARRLKVALERDFLHLIQVFVSSDTESIAAGEEWLTSIERALGGSALLIILCSPVSIGRPWINFEAGAAWMRGIPLVPLCHAGLTPRDLPMPLSLRQGAELEAPDGLRRLYARIADVLTCQVPARSFEDLVREIVPSNPASAEKIPTGLTRERAIRKRLKDALVNHRFGWRTIERVAFEAAISEDLAADLLRADPEVRFSKGKSGNVIVGLRSRVG